MQQRSSERNNYNLWDLLGIGGGSSSLTMEDAGVILFILQQVSLISDYTCKSETALMYESWHKREMLDFVPNIHLDVSMMIAMRGTLLHL